MACSRVTFTFFLPLFYTYEPWEELFYGHHLFKSDILLFIMERMLTKILDQFTFDERGCVVTMVSSNSAGRPLSNLTINVKNVYSIESGVM